jgi:hypothetical protein
MAGLNKRRQRRVRAETDLRFGPQEDNLSLALQDAAATRDTTIRSARGVSAAQVAAARAATPALARALRGPRSTVNRTESDLAAALQALPGGGGALGGASARDAEGTKRRLAEILAGASAENIARARDAIAGRAFAVGNARTQYGAAADRIGAQRGSLARQEGEFGVTQYDDLTDSARDRAIKRGTQRETGRHNRVSEGVAQQNADTARQKAEAKKKPKVTSPAKVDSVSQSVTAAVQDAGRLQKAGRSRSEAAALLATGRTSQTLKNDADGNPLPNPVKIPGVGKVKSRAVAKAALDMAYNGYLSADTIKALKKLGITPAQLGLRTAPRTAAPLPAPPPLPSGAGALGVGGLGVLPRRPTA